ncbi:hypothetical protein E2C01_024988 [Portunus trituberculatus]|uniref:Uncharacterized protein n=1 Tax=Portunus trituberculatus TaxID=210409 RepID=A0A5B7EFD1_PORTR|nr:hypothetical protein [Portunus trituberculatus]
MIYTLVSKYSARFCLEVHNDPALLFTSQQMPEHKTHTFKDVDGSTGANDGQWLSVVEFPVLVLPRVWLVVGVGAGQRVVTEADAALRAMRRAELAGKLNTDSHRTRREIKQCQLEAS